MHLIRKVTPGKWSDDSSGSSRIPADAVTGDLRTSGNRLSLWRAVDTSDAVEDIALALAANFERSDRMALVWFDESALTGRDVHLEESEGNTPVRDLVDRHVDAVHLDLDQLGAIAGVVQSALVAGQMRRFSKRQVQRLVADAVGTGQVALADLDERLRCDIEKELERASG